MRGRVRGNHSGGDARAPQLAPVDMLAAPPDGTAKPRRAGPSFALGGLGVAAIATILAFFGIGLSLLTAHPAQDLHLGSLSGIFGAAQPAPEPAGPAAAGRKPSSAASVALPPPTADGTADVGSAAAAPVAAARHLTLPSPRAASEAGSLPASPAGLRKPATLPLAPPLPPSPSNPGTAVRAIATPPLSATAIAGLLAEGDAAFRRGDLGAARLSYQQAFDAGAGRGALGIGASYDPFFLQHFHLWTERPDPAAARVWYRRAREHGAAEAEGRLDRLKAKQQEQSTPP